jgi:hypothetical protein
MYIYIDILEFFVLYINRYIGILLKNIYETLSQNFHYSSRSLKPVSFIPYLVLNSTMKSMTPYYLNITGTRHMHLF